MAARSVFVGILGLLKAKSRLARAAFRIGVYRSLIVVTTALTPLATATGNATEFRPHELIVSDPVTGAAIFGFDPVAYQLERKPVAGREAHQMLFGGTVWHFSSEANRSAFSAMPESYVPALGGHDPVAVAAGLPVAGNPRLHAIRDGRVYLFRTAENRARFLADMALAAEAARVWPEVKRGLQP